MNKICYNIFILLRGCIICQTHPSVLPNHNENCSETLVVKLFWNTGLPVLKLFGLQAGLKLFWNTCCETVLKHWFTCFETVLKHLLFCSIWFETVLIDMFFLIINYVYVNFWTSCLDSMQWTFLPILCISTIMSSGMRCWQKWLSV